MKRIFLFAILIIIPLLISGQNRIYLDENDTIISEGYFQKKWRDKRLYLTRWDSIGSNKKTYSKLKKGLYQKVRLDYQALLKELEKISSIKFSDNSIILIEYYYKDDLCTSNRDNRWTRTEINNRKRFLDPIKKDLNNSNYIFVCLFENGINLHSRKNKEKEYFFLDKNDFFRKTLFTNATLCGSQAIIKTNGQILVRNGEYRADFMANHLKPEVWNLFFKND